MKGVTEDRIMTPKGIHGLISRTHEQIIWRRRIKEADGIKVTNWVTLR